jgi:acetyl-CoA acetyltransferase
MKGKVAIIGTGMAKCGKSPVPSSLLFAEASLEAIKEASLTISEIQGLHVGNAYSATTESQTNIAPVILSALGVKNNIPCARYEAACCSGSIAFRQGYLNILSGEYDYLLVGGTERLRAVSGTEIQEAMATGMDVEERKAGLTFGSYWAYVVKAYARKYGIKITLTHHSIIRPISKIGLRWMRLCKVRWYPLPSKSWIAALSPTEQPHWSWHPKKWPRIIKIRFG